MQEEIAYQMPPVSLQRIVRLGGAVDDDMANLLVAQLLTLDSTNKKKDITMYVTSPGGSVTAGTVQAPAVLVDHEELIPIWSVYMQDKRRLKEIWRS